MQHPASAAALPHCSHAGAAGSALAYRTPMDSSPTILMPSSLQAPQPQEQNGILDWLRKLRLHKYYPVFKQLTMEKVCWSNLLGLSHDRSSGLIPGGTELCSECVTRGLNTHRRPASVSFCRRTRAFGFPKAACS